jgi:hypothetical protein
VSFFSRRGDADTDFIRPHLHNVLISRRVCSTGLFLVYVLMLDVYVQNSVLPL